MVVIISVDSKTNPDQVEDDVVECETVYEEKCEDETSGYTTNTKCTKWPKEVCEVVKEPVTKFTPVTGCTKEPITLCAPAGCGFTQVINNRVWFRILYFTIAAPKNINKIVPVGRGSLS